MDKRVEPFATMISQGEVRANFSISKVDAY